MDGSNIKLAIIDMVRELPVWSVNGLETQWTTRCPFCGDSVKHSDHGHFSMYINVIDNETPMMYRCLRCGESGLLTADILSQLDMSITPDIHHEIKAFNKQLSKVNRYVNKFLGNNFVIPIFSKSRIHDLKLAYISKRLGYEVDYVLAQKLNIILNIFEFMVCNKIESIPLESYQRLKMFNDYYVGFLNSNKNQIINRCMYDDARFMRYYKIVIDPSNMSPNKYYNIGADIDIMYTSDIQISITEGIFDIMSVYLNLGIDDTVPSLYYAGCGFNGDSVLKYLVYNGICTGLNVHIYQDNDKTDAEHKRYLMAPNMNGWLDHIYLHRNTFEGEKDYGVPLNRITDGKFKLK